MEKEFICETCGLTAFSLTVPTCINCNRSMVLVTSEIQKEFVLNDARIENERKQKMGY